MEFGQSVAALGSIIRSAGGVVDILKGISGLSSAQKAAVAAAEKAVLEMQTALRAAHGEILALENQAATLRDRVEELEGQLARRGEYELRQVARGAFAFVAKGTGEEVSGVPWLCQPCLDDGKQSVFQLVATDPGVDKHECPRCKSVIRTPNDRPGMIFEIYDTLPHH